MPFVTPRSTTTTTKAAPAAAAGPGSSSGRTTFRPPWVKEDAATKPATTPWAKKAAAAKENGEEAGPAPTTSNTKAKATTTAKKTAEELVKKTAAATTTAAAKKQAEPVKKPVPEPTKKSAVEPVKKVAASLATKKPATKKEPTPPPESSSEDEESEEEEEESEEETESEEEATEDEEEEEDDDDDDDDDDDTTLDATLPEHVKKAAQLRPTQINKKPEPQEIPAPPPLPSLVPKAPPPPPPPLAPGEKRVLSDTQKKTLEKLKTRPRRRPDWSEMMKEVESGKKLRHVACNDRSQPILTCKSMTKVDDKFIYETEKDNSHNKLLKQIQGGVRLRPTQTNDRSKPILGGLRKFRRQMTIEEQLHKSQSKVNMLSEAPSSNALGPNSATALGAGGSRPSIVSTMSIDEESPDELDDIDKIRDDLQSTKQMLALELRNREAQERENKKLLAKIRTLETELEREKSREKNLEYGSNVIVATMDPTPTSEQAYVNSLKREVEDARKVSKEVEKNYHDTSELLVEAKTEIEEQKRQIQLLERKLAAALQANTTPSTNRPHISFRFAYDVDEDEDEDDDYYGARVTNNKGGGSADGSRRPSDAHFGRDSSPELELEMSESDPDEPEEKKTERRERRMGKEVKVLRSKLTKLKVKEEAAKKEKDALKQAMKKNHVILKEENKKFKKLEKEVQKMAASMKLDEDEIDAEDKDDEEAAEEEHEEEEAESEEESDESESEGSEEESGSESEAEDAANSAKKCNLEPRVKKHESRFAAMKKCNVLLQANVDNLQDQISQVRSRATNLQDELDAVIADLGF
ncbi:DNA ligase 1 isoform X3 [Drosophila novamexicana]|uniref:DNA ligase 1 isoform X3 n=1 Tax=Drosophila novamexicana TaxID=47314 RepID=UPI0011E5AF7E|nr:DNA ligase 1 isoform X3 [Drosophila novamexicana]